MKTSIELQTIAVSYKEICEGQPSVESFRKFHK